MRLLCLKKLMHHKETHSSFTNIYHECREPSKKNSTCCEVHFLCNMREYILGGRDLKLHFQCEIRLWRVSARNF